MRCVAKLGLCLPSLASRTPLMAMARAAAFAFAQDTERAPHRSIGRGGPSLLI